MQLDKLVGEQLVVLSVGRILILGIGLLHLEELIMLNKDASVSGEHRLEAFLLFVENLLALKQDIVIETQFFLIELVNCFHVLHALLQNLHLSLQLDLLLRLLVCILAHHVL